MIIILGPGFCGTNAIVKYLMDEHHYYFGEQWCTPITKREEKYPIYEDAELYAISLIILNNPLSIPRQHRKDLVLAQDVLSLAINRRINKYKDKWGFKIANAWYKPLLDLWLQLDNVKFIVGTRSEHTLISRMRRDWKDYDFVKAENRINEYYASLNRIKNEHHKPILQVSQQNLLNNPDEQHQRIEEFIA